MRKIYVIEDNLHLAEQVVTILLNQGYDARICKDLNNWEEEFDIFLPDLLLLDINLQVTNGYSICSSIRQKHKLPIIFITGRDSEEDEVRALNLGGDDYIRKPFSDAILLAHIDRLMKAHSFSYREQMSYRNLELNLGKRQVKNVDTNQDIELSGMEFQIIFYLMGKAETIVSREELMDYLWTNRLYVDENALNVNLSRLRSKLSHIDADHAIQSVKGEGLCLSLVNI